MKKGKMRMETGNSSTRKLEKPVKQKRGVLGALLHKLSSSSRDQQSASETRSRSSLRSPALSHSLVKRQGSVTFAEGTKFESAEDFSTHNLNVLRSMSSNLQRAPLKISLTNEEGQDVGEKSS